MPVKESAQDRRQRVQFEKERRSLQRALPKAIKAAARSSGWLTKQGTLFREADGWFIEVHAIPWIIEAKTPARMHCKPMGLDPIFWQLTGMDENNGQPLSFRAFGAFTCRTPTLREADIPEELGSAERIAENLLAWADEQFQSLRGTMTTDAFIEFIRKQPDQVERKRHLVPLILGLLFQGKDEEALAVAQEVKDRSDGGLISGDGGFVFNINGQFKSFTDLVIEQIGDKLRLRIVD